MERRGEESEEKNKWGKKEMIAAIHHYRELRGWELAYYKDIDEAKTQTKLSRKGDIPFGFE